MSRAELIDIFEKLPADKQKEVEDFTAFLLSKTMEEKAKMYPHIKPGFGGGKGIFGELPDDFDEPLEEMKPYM